MSLWRTRGYVQDSDEEDEYDSQETYAQPDEGQGHAIDPGNTDHANSNTPRRALYAKDSVQAEENSEDELAQEDPNTTARHFLNPSARIFNPHATSQVQSANGSRGSQTSQIRNDGSDGLPNIGEIAASPPGHGTLEEGITRTENGVRPKNPFSAVDTLQNASQRLPVNSSSSGLLFLADSSSQVADDLDELQDDWPGQPAQTHISSSLPAQERSELLLPPSSPPELRRDVDISAEDRGEVIPFHGQPRATVVIPRMEKPTSVSPEVEQMDDGELARIGRALRKRNPIQLHPYLLENEKYRQSLRARGLRPIKVAAPSTRHVHDEHRGNEGQTTQDRDFLADHTQSSEFQNSSQTALPSSPPPNDPETLLPNALPPSEQQQDAMSDSDEFPDLSVLVQRKHAGAIQQGAKRRKTAQTYSRKNLQSRLEQPLPARGEELRVFDIPPSPPPSRTPPVLARPRVQDRLRLLPSLSPERPPTPAVSSSRKPIRRRVVRSDSEEESPERRPRPRSDHSAVNLVSSESENDSDEDIHSHLRQLQRRIKGVLPASWLRLDYQAQAEKEQQKEAQPSKENSRARKKSAFSRTPSVRTGVTVTSVRSNNRRRPSTAGESVGHAEQTRPLDLFSDDSEADMPADALHPGAQEGLESDVDFDDNMISQGGFEAPEHDWVDPMLPSGSRSRTSDKPKRKKQTRLTDTMHSRKRMRLDKSEASPRVSAPRVSSSRTTGTHENRATNPRSRKPRASRLSVLDAPVFQASGSEKLPAFLRVAARSVRHRADKGRRSPKMKHIRLQTAADTEDANSVLREWRAGTIRPSMQPDFRQPKSRNLDTSENAEQQRLPALENFGDGSREHGLMTENEGASPQQRPKKGLRQVQLTHVQSLNKPGAATSRNEDALRKGQHRRTSKQTLRQPDYRTAQLEGLEDDYDRRHRTAAFKKNLSKINRSFVDNLRAGTVVANPQLSKFLEDKDEVASLPVGQSRIERGQESNNVLPESEREPQVSVRQPRKGRVKRPAQRLDTEAREYRQPSEPLPQLLDDQSIPIESDHAEADCVEGLGPFGTRYTTNFDVLPLSMGTFFHESTFVGGGELKAALDLEVRDMNTPTRAHVFSLDGKTFRWGAWTDEVASDLGSLWSTIIARHGPCRSPGLAESQEDISSIVDCLCLLRSVLRFVSVHLHFLDPVDRRSFVLHMFSLLGMASAKFSPSMTAPKISFSGQNTEGMAVRATMFLSLITFQTLQIANNTTIDSSIKNDLELLFKSVMGSLLKSVLKHGMVDLRKYLEDNRRHLVRERGINEEDLAIETVVVSEHVLNLAKIPQFSFWDIVRKELLPPVQCSRHVATFERTWYDIFTLLPYLEFDTIGVLRAGRRYHTDQGDWSLGMPLLSRALKLYPATSQKPGVAVNGYIRACLCRCHCLIQNWNWKRCEPVLTTIFDFFSHRGFNNLQNEDSKGSPRFLHMLNQHPSLVIQPDDRTFHVFLKTLAVGLKALRGVYNERQIRNVSWRLVPNHRRSYRKEEGLHQQDLDGLRNQHDLLCTLYWASPPKSRAGLTFLRNLVDQTASHREVCRLSVKAWSILARFQISTDEGTTALEPFTEWFRDIITQNLTQHRLARSEAEAQYEAMRFQGHEHISPQQLQMTIRTNQSQILATILDAVVGLKMAISAAHDLEIAAAFLQDSSVWDIFRLFDAKSADVISLMVEVVEVFQAFMQIVQDRDNENSGESQQTEDSQDYGEWPDLEDEGLFPRQAARPSGPSVDFLQDSLWQLLSTCFGADVPPEDKLLSKIVEAWTRLASRSVRVGKKEWDNYLDAYGTHSWRQLQDTEQTRKYGPYFMALMMEQNSTSHEQHKQDFLTSWMLCLVERESMLKFQHRFTSALLNADPDHPLLQNLPFLKNSKGLFDIKLSEFRERRLSLISTILSNMRDAYDEAIQTGHGDLPGLRRELSHLLKQLMNAMKRNYQELQRETSVKGSYVAFVQSVVEFLQQYISEIHPIDKFFTDSSVFPLPATDPTYVVGRLKSYTTKLSTPRALKQLVIFVKTVTERAAFDAQQAYLVSQLHVAVSNTFEHGPTTTMRPSYTPTLRHVLLRAIFPAYVALGVSQDGLVASFLFSAPVLKATAHFFADLPTSFSATDPRSCTVTVAMLDAVLDAMLPGPLALFTTHTHLLELPHVLRTVALLLRVVQASVPAATYIAMRTRSTQGAALVKKIMNIRKCALWISSVILGADEINAGVPDLDLDERLDNSGLVVALPDGHADAVAEQEEQDRQQREARLLSDIRAFCEREVKESLEGGEWIRLSSATIVSGGQESAETSGERQEVYLFTRGGNRREVHVSTCSLEKGKQEVVQAVEALWAVCEACGIAVDAGLTIGVDGFAGEESRLHRRRARDVVFPGDKDEIVII